MLSYKCHYLKKRQACDLGHTWNTFPNLLLSNLDSCHVGTGSRARKSSVIGLGLTRSSTKFWAKNLELPYGGISVENIPCVVYGKSQQKNVTVDTQVSGAKQNSLKQKILHHLKNSPQHASKSWQRLRLLSWNINDSESKF